MRGLAILAFVALVLPAAAAAQPGLMGRDVTFQVLTYNDPDKPEFQGAVHRTRVGAKAEFRLGYEGAQNDLDVVPILVDISETRVEISYSNTDPGELWTAKFNGYVITFAPGCPLIERARVDQTFTNLPFDNKRISVEGNVLRLNVSAQIYDRNSRIGVDLTLSDCPSG